MATKKVQIQIDTKADSAPIRKLKAEMQSLVDTGNKAKENAKKAVAEFSDPDASAASAQAADVRKIKILQLAQIAQGARQAIGPLKDMAAAIEKTSPAQAKVFNNVATGIDSISSAVSGAAAGFAAGGPAGAILGFVTGLAGPSIKLGIDELADSLANLAESEAIGNALPGRIAAVKKALLVEQQTESWRKFKTAIDEANNQLLRAQGLARDQRELELTLAQQDLQIAQAGGDPKAIKGAQDKADNLEQRNKIADIEAPVVAATQNLKSSVEAYNENVKAIADATEKGLPTLGALLKQEVLLEAAYQKRLQEFDDAKIKEADSKLLNSTGNKTESIIEKESKIDDSAEKTKTQVSSVLGNVETAIGDAANDPANKAKIEQIKALAVDGFTGAEQDEAIGLLNQLISQSKAGQTETSALYREFIALSGDSVSEIGKIKGEIDELRRQLKNTLTATKGAIVAP